MRTLHNLPDENDKKLAEQFLNLIELKKFATVAEIKSKSRKQRLNHIRQAYCKIIYENTNLSSVQIGRMVNRDHATVIHCSKQDSNKFMPVYDELLILFINLNK